MNWTANDSVYLFSIMDLFCLLLHTGRMKTIEIRQPIERSEHIGLTISVWTYRSDHIGLNISVWPYRSEHIGLNISVCHSLVCGAAVGWSCFPATTGFGTCDEFPDTKLQNINHVYKKVGIKINTAIDSFNVRFCSGRSEIFLAVDWATGIGLPDSAVIPLHKTICRTTTRLPFPSLQWIHSSVIQAAYLLKSRISIPSPSERLLT